MSDPPIQAAADGSDGDLLPRIAAGDPAAPEALVNRYERLVWALALRASRDRSSAEDAVQEIFVNLWQNASRFDPAVASESTFVAMVARRRLIDRGRRLQRRPDAYAPDDGIQEMTADGGAPDPVFEHRDESDRVAKAFTQLRPEQQRVLRLAIGSGRTHEEIAVGLDMPVGTVKTHARRGLMRLRALLQEPDGTQGREGSAPGTRDTERPESHA